MLALAMPSVSLAALAFGALGRDLRMILLLFAKSCLATCRETCSSSIKLSGLYLMC